MFCELFLINRKKHLLDCINAYKNSIAFSNNEKPYIDYDCPNCKKCCIVLNVPYRIFSESNAVVNKFSDNKLEIVSYKKPFNRLVDNVNLGNNVKIVEDIDLGKILIPVNEEIRDIHLQDNIRFGVVDRNFVKVDTEEFGELLIAKDEDKRDWHLSQSIKKGSKRAQNTYYGFALSKEWKYFATVTVDGRRFDRYEDSTIKKFWQLFLQKLKRFDKDISILGTPERHLDGALHIHCLIDTQKDFTLKLYEFNGKQKYSKTGAPLFTFDFWEYGICTLAILPKDENQDAVVNYLIQYTTKECNLGYNQKRYFRTRNLPYKLNESTYLNSDELNKMIESNEMLLYKENDTMLVYRNFNVQNPIEKIKEVEKAEINTGNEPNYYRAVLNEKGLFDYMKFKADVEHSKNNSNSQTQLKLGIEKKFYKY